MFSHVCTPCNVPDEIFFRNAYRQVPVYENSAETKGSDMRYSRGKIQIRVRALTGGYRKLTSPGLSGQPASRHEDADSWFL